MIVAQVKPGETFRVSAPPNHWDFKMIYVNDCRALVEPLEKRKKVISRRDDELSDILGDEIVAEFTSHGQSVNIAPMTECELLTAQEDNMETAKRAGAIKRGGDRHFDPKKQDKPVRPGTIREKLLTAIVGGESSVPKLMKKFDMNRNLLIAHVHEMWKRHGYGYAIVGDRVTIAQPAGVKLTPKAEKTEELDDLL